MRTNIRKDCGIGMGMLQSEYTAIYGYMRLLRLHRYLNAFKRRTTWIILN